jgi:threonine dehydrogenase-like Zn-dependent dehydrogenase
VVARPQGRIVVLGGFRKPLTLDFLQPLIKEQSVIFANCYAVLEGRHEFDMAIEMIASGRVPVAQMVTHRFPLERVQEAFNTAYDKRSGSIKVQVFP